MADIRTVNPLSDSLTLDKYIATKFEEAEHYDNMMLSLLESGPITIEKPEAKKEEKLPGAPATPAEPVEEPGIVGGILKELGQVGEKITEASSGFASAVGLDLPEKGAEKALGFVAGLPTKDEPTSPSMKGLMTGLAAIPAVGGIIKGIGKAALREAAPIAAKGQTWLPKVAPDTDIFPGKLPGYDVSELQYIHTDELVPHKISSGARSQDRNKFYQKQFTESPDQVKPLVVEPLPGGKFEIVSGSRRHLVGTTSMGYEYFPAVVVERGTKEALPLAMRADLPETIKTRLAAAITKQTPVRPHELVAEEATRYGDISPEFVKGLAPTTAMSDAQTVAVASVVAHDTNRVLHLRDAVIAGNKEAEVEFMAQIQSFVDVYAPFIGIRHTAGQALNAPSPAIVDASGKLASRIKSAPALATPLQLATAMQNLNTVEDTASFLVNANKPGWKDVWQYTIVNSLLSPTSDFINATATAGLFAYSVPERALAGRLGGGSGVVPGEASAMLHGVYNSFWDAMKVAAYVGATGNPLIRPGVTRSEQRFVNPFTSETLFNLNPAAARAIGGATMGGMSGAVMSDDPMVIAGTSVAGAGVGASMRGLQASGPVGRAINLLGVTLGLPGRLMLTGDQFIQALAVQSQAHALAYRNAYKEMLTSGHSLSPKEFRELYQPIRKSINLDLPESLRKPAEDFSLDITLNRPLHQQSRQSWASLGGEPVDYAQLASSLQMLRDKAGILGTIAAPFFRTLTNSVFATNERTPFALMGKHFWNEVRSTDPVRRDMAVAKASLGTMAMSSLVMVGLQGRLRGHGPDNKELRLQEREAKGLPDSYVFRTEDGASIQLNRLGTLGNLIGMAADASDVWHQADDATKGELSQLLLTAYVSNLSFDFLQGTAGILQALVTGVRNEKDLNKVVATVASELVPGASLIRTAEQMTSDQPMYMKDARDMMDKILARFPGYDSLAERYGLPKVPVMRNQFGKAIEMPHSAWGTEWFNPMYISKPTEDPQLRKILDKEIELGIGIAAPSRFIKEMPLTNEEYDRYQVIAGKITETRLRGLERTGILDSKAVSDYDKSERIRGEVRTAREQAKEVLLSENRKLTDDLVKHQTNRRMPAIAVNP